MWVAALPNGQVVQVIQVSDDGQDAMVMWNEQITESGEPWAMCVRVHPLALLNLN